MRTALSDGDDAVVEALFAPGCEGGAELVTPAEHHPVVAVDSGVAVGRVRVHDVRAELVGGLVERSRVERLEVSSQHLGGVGRCGTPSRSAPVRRLGPSCTRGTG